MSNLKMPEPQIFFYIVDDLNRFFHSFTINSDTINYETETECCESRSWKCPKKITAFYEADGYFMSIFNNLLKSSEVYSRMVINNLLRACTPGSEEIIVKFRLVKPKLDVLDYSWNNKICHLLAERQELEHAMSWLSTLGGAFSALGDSLENCAKVAGKISIQQFRIAFRLGEPPLVARCRLYMAVSLIQLGKLSLAKRIIEEQFQYAKNLNDIRLGNICKGVWAKLQYIYKLKKTSSKKTKL